MQFEQANVCECGYRTYCLAYRIRKSEIFAWHRNFNLTHVISPQKRKFSCEFGLHWLCRTSRNFVARLPSLRRHNYVRFIKCPTSTSLCVVINATYKIKPFEIERYARKSIKHGCSVWIENSVPQDHCFASLGKALWCKTVTLGTEFSICTSHPCKILTI